MRRVLAIACCIAGLATSAPGSAAPLTVPDQKMDRYFSVWADNAEITPATVSHFYARRVSYYGKAMSAEGVYRDKAAYVRQWPARRYDVVPGSVGKTCDDGENRCRLTAILRWRKAGAGGRDASQGANTITLDLVRQDGFLKIARESGTPVASAACHGPGAARRCSGFR